MTKKNKQNFNRRKSTICSLLGSQSVFVGDVFSRSAADICATSKYRSKLSRMTKFRSVQHSFCIKRQQLRDTYARTRKQTSTVGFV